MNDNIPTPCEKELKKYLGEWDRNDTYVLNEKTLSKLFIETFPNNTAIEEIYTKAKILNDFYSTHIYSIIDVAKHILALDIDERLKAGDLTLVSDIANIEIGGKKKVFYSFATKYCSHHNQTDFPIYDSNVDKVLMYFKKRDKFESFKQSDLKDYPTFKRILLKFAEYYGIADYSLKEIDMYLWQFGKDEKYFPKKK